MSSVVEALSPAVSRVRERGQFPVLVVFALVWIGAMLLVAVFAEVAGAALGTVRVERAAAYRAHAPCCTAPESVLCRNSDSS